jgi:hypothetical protein
VVSVLTTDLPSLTERIREAQREYDAASEVNRARTTRDVRRLGGEALAAQDRVQALLAERRREESQR